MVARCFANSDALSLLTLGPHNELLSGDELTTVQLNRDWRRLVTAALYYYWRHKTDELSLDNEDMLDDLLADIYDAETFTMRKFTLHRQSITANFTTNSLVPVAVTNSNFNHTFTYPNAIVSCYNISNSNGGVVGQQNFIQVDCTQKAADSVAESVLAANTKETMAVSQYSELEVGEVTSLRLIAWVTGNTMTIAQNVHLVYIIEEWE